MEIFHVIWVFLKQSIRKIIFFFKSNISKEVMIFLVFLLVSLFFWTLQSLQEITEYQMKIPVTYEAVPETITITNKLPEVLNVTLRDRGTSLYYYYKHRKDLAVHINPMEWYRNEGIGNIHMGTVESLIRSKLRQTTQLLSMKPDTISVFFVEKASKVVPVELIKDITLSPQHFQIGDPEVQPSTVTVYAPLTILSQLTSVETRLLKVTDLKKTTTYAVQLKTKDGLQFSDDKVRVTIRAEEFTERTLKVPVKGLNFPAEERLLSFPPEVSLSYFIGLSSYDEVDESDFKVGIEYGGLVKSETKSHKVKLISFPSNVQNIRIQPEFVDCLIEK